MNKKDPLEVAFELKEFLQGKIYGQDNAIEAVVDSVKNKVLDESNRPKQIYFFLGPPATGKTYFAQNIMEYFSEYKFLEVNMVEHQSLSSKGTLFGTERGFNTEQNGFLTNFVHTNPKTIVLIDEFEKAHTSIQKKFLTMLSAGYLNDALGWIKMLAGEYEPFDSENARHKVKNVITKVDFTQTIVIFTSNLGSALYNNHEFLEQLDSDYQSAEPLLLQEIAQEKKLEDRNMVLAILPEMLSRLSQGQIVLFNKLQMYPLRKIAADIFNQKIKQLALNYQLQIEYRPK
jgi:ATP-dependent Clp protease ATP-binding subunit ClpA